MRSPFLLLVVASVVLSAACTHTTLVRSDPPGAELYLLPEQDAVEEGEDAPLAVFIGTTPHRLQSPIGGPFERATYVVVHDEDAVQFTLTHGQVTLDSASSAGLSSCAGLTVCGAIAVGSGVGGVALLPVAPWAAVPAFCTSGCCGLIALTQPVSFFFNMWAPADVVTVGLDGKANTVPGGLVDDVAPADPPENTAPLPDAPAPQEPGGAIEVRALAF